LYLTNSQTKQTNKKEDSSGIANKKNSFKIEWYNTDNEQLVTRLTNRFYLYSDSKSETSEWIYLFNCVSKLNQINLINSQQQEVKLKPIIKSQQQQQPDFGLLTSRSNSAPNSPTFKRQQSTNVKFIDQQSKQKPPLYPQQPPLYPQQRSSSFNRMRMFNNSGRSDVDLSRVDHKPIYDAFEKPVVDYPLTTSLSQQTLNRINDAYTMSNNLDSEQQLMDNRRRFKSDQNLTFEKNQNKKTSAHTGFQSNLNKPTHNLQLPYSRPSFSNPQHYTHFDR
jgi:hypothetical protein